MYLDISSQHFPRYFIPTCSQIFHPKVVFQIFHPNMFLAQISTCFQIFHPSYKLSAASRYFISNPNSSLSPGIFLGEKKPAVAVERTVESFETLSKLEEEMKNSFSVNCWKCKFLFYIYFFSTFFMFLFVFKRCKQTFSWQTNVCKNVKPSSLGRKYSPKGYIYFQILNTFLIREKKLAFFLF